MDKIGVEVLLEHAAFVKALARRLVRDEATAEDVAQQTWLAALRRPPDRNPRSWLGTVARNVVRGVVRSDRRRLRRERTAARSESVGPADAEVTRAELLRSVTDAVLALPEQDREVILLRFYENLPPREIARKLGIPAQTVRSRLHRAVSRLRAQLDGKHGGRRVWMLSLAVLAYPRRAGAATTALKGAFLLSTKTKALVVAGIALVALIAAWQVAFPRTEPPRAAAAAAAAPGKTTDEPSPEQDALPESVDFAAIDRERDLHGVVVTPDGRPVAGALVESVYYATRRFDNLFRRLRFDGEAGPQTRTALDGRFKLRLERGDMVYLRVSAEGYPPRELARHQAGERVRIVLSNGVRLVVRIRDESGRPVPKSRLEFLRAHPSSMLEIFARREGETDRDGVGVFEGLTGPGWLYGGAPGYLRTGQRVELSDGDTTEIDLVLTRGTLIRGRVVDETGRPVAGARVGVGLDIDEAVTTDDAGAFELAVQKGVTVTAEGPRHTRGTASLHGLDPLWYTRSDGTRVKSAQTLELRLRRSDTLVGRVLAANGSPIAGALVAPIGSRRSPATRTDADGRFRLDGVDRSPRRPWLLVFARGHARSLQAYKPNPDGPGVTDLGDLVLAPPGAIEGRVLTADGDPMPRVWVRLASGVFESRITDDLGRFHFPDLPPGRYGIWAEPVGAPQIRRTIELRQGERAEVELRYLSTRPLTVIVEDEDGNPVEGAPVTVVAAFEPARATTGKDGRATVLLDAEPTSVMAAPPRSAGARLKAPFSIQLKGTEREVRIVMKIVGVVTGRVVDAKGNPITHVSLEIRRGAERLAGFGGAAGEDGTFTATVPRDGVVTLALTGRTYQMNPNLRPKAIFLGELSGVRPGDKDLVLRARAIPADRTLRIRVVTPDGTPVAGSGVHAHPSTRPMTVPTNADGFVELDGLPARSVRVTASSPLDGRLLPPEPVRVLPNGQILVLRLREGVFVEGKVFTPEGKPAARASVSVYFGDVVLRGSNSDAEGSFRVLLEPDVKGPLRIEAIHWTDHAYKGVVQDIEPGARDIEIRVRSMKQR